MDKLNDGLIPHPNYFYTLEEIECVDNKLKNVVNKIKIENRTSDQKSIKNYQIKKLTLNDFLEKIYCIFVKISSCFFKGKVNRFGLSSTEFQGLKILSKCIKNPDLNESEKKVLSDLLNASESNMVLNAKIIAIKKSGEKSSFLDENEISNNAMTFIIKLTFAMKSTNPDRIKSNLNKLEHGIDKLFYKEEISENEKLTLSEYKEILRLAELQSSLAYRCMVKAFSLKEHESHFSSEILENCQLFSNIKKANLLTAQINELFNQTNPYVNGDIAVYDSVRADYFDGNKASILEKMKNNLVTSYDHMMVLVQQKGKNTNATQSVRQSHVYTDYGLDPFLLEDELISDIWRLDPCQLLNETTPALKLFEESCKRENKDVKKEIQNLYEEATLGIHLNHENEENEKLKLIKNDSWRRYLSGLADIGLAGGHRKKTARAERFQKIHQDFKKGFGEEKTMICSEFTARAMIAAIVELDHLMLKKLENDPQFDQSQVKDLKLDQNGLAFLMLPFEKEERLKRMHSGRVIDELKKKGCVERVQLSSVSTLFKLS